MAVTRGDLFLVKMDVSGTQTEIKHTTAEIDISFDQKETGNKNPTGDKEYLPGGSTREVTISVQGAVELGDAVQKAAFQLWNDGTAHAYELTSENGETWSGTFVPSSYKRSGPKGEAATFSVTLQGSGTVTYTQT